VTTNIKPEAAGSAMLDQRELRQAFGKFTTGVTIVTANVDGKRVGMTANSFSSLSLDPPLVLWSVRNSSTNFHDFMGATHFAVNVLSTSQIELSQRFAKSSTEKFDGVKYEDGVGGSPVFPDTTAVFECSTESLHEAGDHVIMVGRVQKVSLSDHRPLAFSEGRYSASVEHPATRAVSRQPGPDGESADPLRQFISVLLLRALNRMGDELAEVREAEDITTNETRILNMVDTFAGRTLAQHMPVIYMTDIAAEDALQGLISKGFVTADGRGQLSVTPAGHEKSERMLAEMTKLESRFLKTVPPVQVELLRHTLADIIEADING
jgi:flavin reductase (DIM6/NTAB) family NADH-FMN oxidoreductase RutF